MRTAIVTGASRGIGRAIAARLLTDGWEVVNLDRMAPTTQADLGDRWVEADLADADATRAALANVLRDGPVTGLVNNAAVGRMSALAETSVDEFEESVAVNMRAPMLCAQAVLPGMKSAGFGRIVNIASRAHLGKTLRTSYAGTKGAIVSMTKQYPGHAKRVMMGVWSFLRQFMYTKFVIVTDDDVNVRDWRDVVWAMTTRMDPARDTTVIENTPIDYLDFASPVAGLGSKMGFDATTKLDGESDRLWGRPIRMSSEVRERIDSLWSELGIGDADDGPPSRE